MNKRRHPQKAALITGAARRIGRAISLSLAARGYAIAIHYNRSEGPARTLAADIRRKKGRCELFPCDLTDAEATEALIGQIKKTYPGLDVLVNCASVFGPSSIKGSRISKLHDHLAVNFNAPFILTGAFVKKCRRGNIINILDTHIVSRKTRYSAYLLSKKALWALTQQSAVELAPKIRVNAVAPGIILPSAYTKKDQLRRMVQKVPLKRRGSVADITRSVEFLLDSPFITGQVIFADGGEHLV